MDKLEQENQSIKEVKNYERAQKIVMRDTIFNHITTINNLKQKLGQIQRDYSHLLKQKKDCEDRSYSFEQKLEKIKELA